MTRSPASHAHDRCPDVGIGAAPGTSEVASSQCETSAPYAPSTVGASRTRPSLATLFEGRRTCQRPGSRPATESTAPVGDAAECSRRCGALGAAQDRGTPDTIQPGVTVVTGKELVAPVAREGDSHRSPGYGRHQMRGQLGAVGEWLVPDLGYPGYEIEHVLGGHVHRRVLRTEMRRHGGSRCRLVECLVLEGDGEGTHPVAAVVLHQGHGQARVDSPGEQSAHGHLGHRAGADGVGQRVFHDLDCLGIVAQGAEPACCVNGVVG